MQMAEEDIDIEFTPGYSSTPENESRKHVLTPPMVDRTSLRTIIYDAILIALTRRGFLYLALPITPCALIFPALETSCKPLRRREIYRVSQKKKLRKFNRLLYIINVAKQFDFYIGRKSCYLAFL